MFVSRFQGGQHAPVCVCRILPRWGLDGLLRAIIYIGASHCPSTAFFRWCQDTKTARQKQDMHESALSYLVDFSFIMESSDPSYFPLKFFSP